MVRNLKNTTAVFKFPAIFFCRTLLNNSFYSGKTVGSVYFCGMATISKEQKLYRKILWFDKRLQYDIDFFDILRPQRQVSEHHRYKSGVFFSEKCGREIQYESGLELNFIKQLEQLSNVLFYYEQPVQINYWRGRKKQTYTPDFGLYLNTKEFVLVEIKDLPSMLDDRVQMKAEGLMGFCAKRGFGLLLYDGRYSFDKLLKLKNNRRLEKEILSALANNVLRGKQYKEIVRKCNSTQNELLKVIIKHNLKFKPFPFKLQHGNKNELFRQVFVEKRKYEEALEEKYLRDFGSDKSSNRGTEPSKSTCTGSGKESEKCRSIR